LPEALDSGPLCVQAEAWVAAHGNDLPKLYDQLVSFPMSHRRAIFGNLAPESRANLWQEQLSRFVTQRTLSTDQRDFIGWSRTEVVTADNYRRGGPGHDVLVEAARRIEELFPDDDDRRVFVRLGPDKPRLTSLEGVRLNAAHRVRSVLYAEPARSGRSTLARMFVADVYADSGTCGCNVESGGIWWWECGPSVYYCQYNGCASWQACGPFGFANCDGCCCGHSYPPEIGCNCN
jgi:hypothetical protein